MWRASRAFLHRISNRSLVVVICRDSAAVPPASVESVQTCIGPTENGFKKLKQGSWRPDPVTHPWDGTWNVCYGYCAL